MYYLTNKDPRMLVGLGGSEQDVVGSLGTHIAAIDYQTGKVAWRYRFERSAGGFGGGTGLLTTAGGLLFANDGSGNLVAFGLKGTQPLVPLLHAAVDPRLRFELAELARRHGAFARIVIGETRVPPDAGVEAFRQL